jgi:molecular chaperone DnaK (HSP70)
MGSMNVGIDFGTCFTSVALDTGGKVIPVQLQDAKPIIPSSVFLNDDGTMELGWRAERMKQLNPERYRTHFKRDLGSSVPCNLVGGTFYPHELITRILRLAFDSLKSVGWSPDADSTVTITVPATHQEKKKELMRTAAAEAGFHPDRIAVDSEPVAAAAYYLSSAAEGVWETTLVYDFGGGTFDAAIVKKEPVGFSVVSMPAGIERLGGNDLDEKIYKHLADEIGPPGNEPLINAGKSGRRLRHRVIEDCIYMKHALSDRQSAEFALIPPLPLDSFQMTRRVFESLIGVEVERTLSVCRQLLEEADLTWRRISRILMVGGSCRIPYFRQRLKDATGRPVSLADEPELAVCLGAAQLPSLLRREDQVYAAALGGIRLMCSQLSWGERKQVQAIYRHRAHIHALRTQPGSRLAVAAFVQKVLECTAGLGSESVSESDRLTEDFGLVDMGLREVVIGLETLLGAHPAVSLRIGQIADETLKTGLYTKAAHQQLRAELREIPSPGPLTDILMQCKTVKELIDKTLVFFQQYRPEPPKPPGVLLRLFD